MSFPDWEASDKYSLLCGIQENLNFEYNLTDSGS